MPRPIDCYELRPPGVEYIGNKLSIQSCPGWENCVVLRIDEKSVIVRGDALIKAAGDAMPLVRRVGLWLCRVGDGRRVHLTRWIGDGATICGLRPAKAIDIWPEGWVFCKRCKEWL